MIDRAELEMTLALAEKGIRCEAPAEVMAYLCRRELERMDAPVGTVVGVTASDEVGMLESVIESGQSFANGTRVSLVTEVG